MNFVKKTAFIVTFVLVFSFIFYTVLNSARAQDFTFDKAYQDYIFTQSSYSDSYKAYTKARDTYLKNSTLTLKEDARIRTLAMLRNRDELYRVYLTALRMKITEVGGLTESEKNLQLTRIDSEVNWYKDHKEAYKDSDSLETLFNKSKEARDRYELDTERKIYDALFNISLGEVIDSRVSQEAVYVEIRKEIDKAVSDNKVRIDPFNRWFTDIENVVGELKAQEDKAKKQIARIYTEGYSNPPSVFRTSTASFETSKELLLTLNNYLDELLTSFNANLAATQ